MKQITFTNGKIYTPSKIIGVGRNYAEHIKEMKAKPTKEPVLFLKPNSAIHEITAPIPIPSEFGSVHYEIELAVCIGHRCSHVSESEAFNHVAGYGLALDLTLRDEQAKAKKQGLPWAVAKGFDNSCPLSVFKPKNEITDPQNLNLLLATQGWD